MSPLGSARLAGPLAALLAGPLAALLAGCGGGMAGHGAPPRARPAPVDWSAACAGPARERLERMRQLALQSSVDDLERVAALGAWHPRGRGGAARAQPVSPEARAVAVELARRAVSVCGLAEAIELTQQMVTFQTVAAIADNPELERMAAWLESFATDAGLTMRVIGANDAWEIELGGRQAGRAVAVLTHADVVPVNDPPTLIEPDSVPSGWSVAPFVAETRDGRLYGRGTEDDKGPIAASLVALATLADAGLTPRQSLLLVMGTAEEDDWDGMRRYAERAAPITYVISADAEYPVVVAESGFVSWGLAIPMNPPPPVAPRAGRGRRARRAAAPQEAAPTAVYARGGLFLTQVPDEAELIVVAADPAELLSRARTAAEHALARHAPDRPGAEGITGTAQATEHEGRPAVRLRFHGVSAHSSEPENGLNALWLLADAASELGLADNAIATMLRILHERFSGDHLGALLGIAHEDATMGPLIVAPTVLRVEDGEVSLRINMRRPRGLDSAQFGARLDEAFARLRATYGEALTVHSEPYIGEPHVVLQDGVLVSTLLDIYREHTGQPIAQPLSIRGGTYARLFEGAVSFGPSYPDRPYRGHGADEHIFLDALGASTRMLMDAYLRLGLAEESSPEPPGSPRRAH